MKLELKHLAPYLPYGLEVKHTIINKHSKIIGIEFTHELRIRLSNGLYAYYDKILLPILRPFSDLKYKSTSELKSKYNINDDIIFWIQELTEKNIEIKYLTVETYNFLLQHHFDIFGLIDKGLAISIHDVEQVIA